MNQKEKVIAAMIRHPKQEWWHGEDVANLTGDLFIGYKAPTRLCELALDYPNMIESQQSPKNNRQLVFRFRFENTAVFMDDLTDDLRRLVRGELLRAGKPFEIYKLMPVETGNGTVRMERQKVTVNSND